MKRVVVTGASGFIGKPCVEALQNRNFEVHAISSKPVPQNKSAVVWHCVDLHDHLLVKELLATIRPSFLLHSAWYVEHGTYWTSDENLKWVVSSLNLIEQFINNGGQRLVCLGTCAEYDWSDKSCYESFSEKRSLINPSTLYGASKVALYSIINALCLLKGVEFAWGRLFFPYGPYEQAERLIPNTVVTLLKGNIAVCKYPGLERDFIFVQDIAEILAILLDSKVTGPINIASGQAISLGDVVKSIAKLLNAENSVQFGSSDKKNSDPAVIVGDITKLKCELGFTKITTLEKGLEKTIDWWRSEYQ